MFKHIKRITFSIAIITTSVTFAQDPQEKDNDTINTQVVNVVKPYTPTISDAFKVKEVPKLEDSVTTAKKEVKYNIFSIPVASTFTPAKGKAAAVDKQKPERVFDNYASLGFGTYTTILGELYLNYALNRSESVGASISHHSSQGGIDGVILDDDFSKSQARINYAKNLRDMSWNIDLGYQRQAFNWYGLPEGLFDEETVNNIDPKHVYSSLDLGGEIEFDDLFINSGSVRFRRFIDDYSSFENNFIAKTVIEFPVRDELIKTHFKFDYLGGGFNKDFNTGTALDYGNIQVGVSPSYQLTQDDLTVNVGFTGYFLNDIEAGESKFFIYPNVTASYKLVQDILIPYGGITGDLLQNTYHKFAQENPFVSPSLFIAPTDQQYNAFVGLKGKLSNTMSYNVRGNYYAEKGKALFKANQVNVDGIPEENYQYGNSFGVVYDDVSTISILGELNVDINRNFNLGIKAEYFNYDTDLETEAWNLPDFKASLFLDYQITEQWFAGANLYYVGARKSQFSVIGNLVNTAPLTVDLDSYFDANAHVGYRINDRWSAYVKANNIASQAYNRWLNYPVQSIQFLAGATYKFDF